MDYVFCLVVTCMIVGAVVLSTTPVPYYGVISLMGLVFFCCVVMLGVGRTFIALVTFVVYLGGLVVVFSYCISVEKDVEDVLKVFTSKVLVFLFVCVGVVACLWVALVFGMGEWFVVISQDCFVCVEINGFGVLYSNGGLGLMVCSWGLLVTLFSILIVLSWHRWGGLRPF
uniref:NADH-ubiquinone oxidoreductase chain 6 n=1 Tax=Morelia imbricata TaxID=3148407 RepID=A0A0C4M6P0_9SAUR|nr:NADH dehydrogenase subunit 6 [Morelia spilota imbricata]AII19668.1 NADH dehydrogenase subunit 6 [Morelia spilota imbricata]